MKAKMKNFNAVLLIITSIFLLHSENLGQGKKTKPTAPKAVKVIPGDREYNEGDILYEQGTESSLNAALQKYSEAYQLYQQGNDKAKLAEAAISLGITNKKLNKLQNALTHYEDALRIFEQLNDNGGRADTLTNIGAIFRDDGQFKNALEYYQKSLPLQRLTKNKESEAKTLNGIGECYFGLGNVAEGVKFVQQAYNIWLTLGSNQDRVRSTYNLGRIYVFNGETQKGIALLNQALNDSRQYNNPVLEGDILEAIADYHYNNGEIPKSLQIRQQIANAFQNAKAFSVTTYRKLGAISKLIFTFAAVGDFISANEYARVALEAARKENEPYMVLTILLNQGEIFADQGKYSEASNNFNEALSIARKSNFKDVEPNILESLARVNYENDNLNQALDYLNQMAQLMSSNQSEFNEPYLYAGQIITYAKLKDLSKVNELIQIAKSKRLDVGKLEGNLRLAQAIGFAQLLNNQNQEGFQTLKNVYEASSQIGHEVEKARVRLTLSYGYSRAGDLQNAFQHAQASHDFWKKIGNDRMDMETHIQMGLIAFQAGQGQSAIEQFNSALGFAQKLNIPVKQGLIYYQMGITYQNLQNSEQAIGSLNQSLSIYERLKDIPSQVQILNDLGTVYEQSGNKKKAKEYRDKAKKVKI